MFALRKIFSAVSGKPEQVLKNEALRKAAIKGDFGKVQKLLRAGADVDHRDVNGLTPLYFAADHGYNDIVRLLLEHGADPNAGRDGNIEGCALTRAAAEGRLDAVKTLVEFKADLNLTGYEFRTALHEAIWRNHEDIACFLVEAGAKTNTKSRLGSTPFHDAVTYGQKNAGLALAAHGADIDAGDYHHRTVREYAQEKGWTDVIAAADDFPRRQEEARRLAAEEEKRRKEAVASEIANAAVLQNAVTVRKPIRFKSPR